MSVAFCTIITRSHLHWALALRASLEKHQPGLHFVILVTDADDVQLPPDQQERTTVMRLADLRDGGVGDAIQQRYAAQADELRWSLKPVLMLKLLERFDKVLYGDCDLHFFAPIQMLLDQLDRERMLLAPHWRWSQPDGHAREFVLLMTEGLFNGGFVGAHRSARAPLEHWARNCLALCVVDRSRAQFVDQSHLNILPVYHEGIGIIRHRGCNLAFWNRQENVRSAGTDGEVRINGEFPVVFIHFTKSTIRSIATGEDHLLMPYLTRFNQEMERFKPGHDQVQLVLEQVKEEERALAAQARTRSEISLGQRIKSRLRRMLD